MGLLDNNNILTTPKTGLEGSSFKQICSTDAFDLYLWKGEGKSLCLTYRDIFAWVGSGKLYLVQGKITDTPTEIAVNDTNFPHLRQTTTSAWPSIARVIACPFAYATPSNKYGNINSLHGEQCRVCVIFDNGQIYHNYPSRHDDYDMNAAQYTQAAFTMFDESVVWDLPNRKHPVKTTTGTDAELIATGMYYYNPALPDKCYEFHPALNQANGYGNTVGFGATTEINNASYGENIGKRARFWRINMDDAAANSFAYMGGYVNDERYTMIGTYRTNAANSPCRICVFGTQDGGRSWFVMYEFGGRVSRNASNGIIGYAESSIGVPMVQENDSVTSTGIYNIKRRFSIVPDATIKEPEHKFSYGDSIHIASIVSDASTGKITVTTVESIESSTVLVNGDSIVFNFQDGVSANNRVYDWLVNDEADEDSGGNGKIFIVREKTANSFVLAMYPWNPDNNLPVRHIHAINKCKDGVSVSSGEDYSTGGWILYNAIKGADAFGGYNVASLTQNKFVRLNSTKLSFARPLGTIIQQEADGTYAYIGMDTAIVDMGTVEMPEGRTESFGHNSCGVWKTPISGMDSMAISGKLVYGSSETSFGFQKMGTAMVFVGQYGDFALSYDDGKTWSTCKIPVGHRGQNGCHYSGMTYDNRFSIDDILVQLKK